MKIGKTQFANYLGINRSNVKKHYQAYLDMAENKTDFLTVFDVIKIDKLPPEVTCCMLDITDFKTKKAVKIYYNGLF